MNRKTVNEIIEVLFPSEIKCILCNKEIIPNRYGLCENCSYDNNVNFCVRCGRHKVGIGDYCGECSDQTLYFDEARSSVVYDDKAKHSIWQLKYGDARYLSHALGEFMLDTLLNTDWQYDCFTFVPIHAKRLKRRGYNQSELLAAELSDKTTVPCIKLLDKIKATPNQARLSRDERMVNLKDAFVSVAPSPKHVVLVDDVMTTGSTVNECAKTLKRAGASVVYVLTFASVPERPVLDRPSRKIGDFRKSGE